MSLSQPLNPNKRGLGDLFRRFLFAKEPPPLDDCPDISVNPQYLVDIHTHTSMKMNIWGKKFWNRHWPVWGDGLLSMLGMQVDYFQLTSRQVGVMIVAHDLPVGAMRRKFGVLSQVIRVLNWIFDKMEHEDFSNFTQINKIINLFEEQIYVTNRKLGSETFVIARSYQELVNARARGKIVFIHSIEGSHALGRNLPPKKSKFKRKLRKIHNPIQGGMKLTATNQRYINNLVALKYRGVCMLTLAYLFKNELSDCVEGIAEYPKVNTFKYKWRYTPKDPALNIGLSPLGIEVVNKMLEIGMIIDLTHSTPATRAQVYAINKNRAENNLNPLRPLTFSHCGSQQLFEDYQQKTGVKKYNHHKYYAASKQDILEIEACKGVIGIIIENWWLTGVDHRLPEYQGWELSGIDCVLQTIDSINQQTAKKDYSIISIGTDFDGFTDTPPDFYRYEHFGNLLERMQNDKYHCNITGNMVRRFNANTIQKIFSGNALQMLANGWT